jgi:hypothetical protein
MSKLGNIERRTLNAEHRMKRCAKNPSEFDVRCSMFDVNFFFLEARYE